MVKIKGNKLMCIVMWNEYFEIDKMIEWVEKNLNLENLEEN